MKNDIKPVRAGETTLKRNKKTGEVDTYIKGKKVGSVVTMGDLVGKK